MAAVALAISVGDAMGAMMVSDDFSYADGNLVPNDPAIGGAWNAHSSGTAVPVSGGAITLAHGSGSREDVNSPFETGAIGAGDVVYAGFDLTVPDPGAAITDTYFAMFLESTSFFDARIWITAPSSSGFRLAISNDNSITDADGEVRSTDLAFGATYRVVHKYDYTAKKATLWIDPSDESSASISASDPGFSDEVAAYAFRQAGGNTMQIIDCLRVASTFDEAAVCVPEPTSFGLLLMAALGLVGLGRRTA